MTMVVTETEMETEGPGGAEGAEAAAAGAGAGAAGASGPVEDGRTRCSWVAGRPEHYFFHDAEWGFVPDTEELTREKLLLVALLHGGVELVEVLDRRDEVVEALAGWDLAQIGGMDDSALEGVAGRGGIFADAGRLRHVREVARAGVETAKEYKELREYFLAVRFLPAEEQIAELMARFPGMTKDESATLMAMLGTVEGAPHERDCWRA